MKNLVTLLVVILFLSACGDKKSAPEPEAPVNTTPKNITQAFIGPELPVQQRSSAFYVGVRYFKDYSSEDQVTLTFNGQNGVLQNTYKTEQEGTNLLYLFQPAGQAVTGKLKLSIKNEQKTFEKEQDCRITDDLTLKTVWNALSKTYLSGFDRHIERLKTGTFALNSQSTTVLGIFLDNASVPGDRFGRTLIPALQGRYELTYAGDALSEIKIIHGEPLLNQAFSSQKTYTDLGTVYGNFTSRTQQNGYEVTTYNTSEFILTTYLNPTIMYTIIRKK
ncbi:hypothetical protein [Mucilaginibacter terrae]|uniref:DUF4595 domain-containing protein n=1 Tax=Mucilaginibacter terrae TaxID=1955052 RepID=A0ABU3GNF8_9SPHI|nr:hypothetical protein [Mucilaginibacter terrae]MDT3401304.1 hypothetical protein [Mucilaginibacter terrae]